MPPRGVKSAKRGRQYEKIKASAKKQGRSTATAKRIAAATVNKQRREAGETKGSASKRKSSRKTTSRSSGARKASRSRKTAGARTARKTTRSRKSSSSNKR